MNRDKAAGIDNISGKFLKDGANILAKLPSISKIIEKAINDQTQAFLDENKILYRFQSGFRKHFSTDLCLSYLNNKIATGFESGMILV